MEGQKATDSCWCQTGQQCAKCQACHVHAGHLYHTTSRIQLKRGSCLECRDRNIPTYPWDEHQPRNNPHAKTSLIKPDANHLPVWTTEPELLCLPCQLQTLLTNFIRLAPFPRTDRDDWFFRFKHAGNTSVTLIQSNPTLSQKPFLIQLKPDHKHGQKSKATLSRY